MWPVSVVVGDVFGKYVLEVAATEYQHSVQTLTTRSSDEALGETQP